MRLEREILSNVSLQVVFGDRADVFEVMGRGELQMAVLIETMRREGYEFMVSKPQVITKEENGKTLEPVERIFLDIPEEYTGTITEKLSLRKVTITHLNAHEQDGVRGGITNRPCIITGPSLCYICTETKWITCGVTVCGNTCCGSEIACSC